MNLLRFSRLWFQEKSNRLWGFVFAVYWVSVVTYYLLWRAYGHVSGLRAAALMFPEVKPEQFAVLVRDIPAPPVDQTRKEQVDSFFKALYPDTFYRSVVLTDNTKVYHLNVNAKCGPCGHSSMSTKPPLWHI